MIRKNLLLSASLILLIFIVAGCASPVQLSSSWNDKTISVDGNAADWGTALLPLSSPPISIGIRNNDEAVFLCVATQDRFMQAQILNGGLTVWFDPSGKQEKTWGIRYPIHMDEGVPRWNPREPLDATFRYLEPSFREFEILGPGEEDHELFTLVEAKGIHVRVGVVNNTLIYELEVPLQGSGQMRNAVASGPGRALGIGFETPEFGSGRLQGPSGRASAGTGGGRRRGGGAGGGGTGEVGGPGRPEPLKLWTTVTLSSPR